MAGVSEGTPGPDRASPPAPWGCSQWRTAGEGWWTRPQAVPRAPPGWGVTSSGSGEGGGQDPGQQQQQQDAHQDAGDPDDQAL